MAATFHFVCTDSKTKSVLDEPAVAELLRKWSMKQYLRIQRYSFNESFQVYQKQEFAEAFFKDPTVISTLKGFATGSPAPIGIAGDSVSVQRVPCTLTSTAIFRRLEKVGVSWGGGKIVPCAETLVGDISINNRLQSILLNEDDESWDTFSQSERHEFLFLLVRLLAIGGRWCQYDDHLQPYIETGRAIYKDLVSVEKDSSSAKPVVRTVVLKVIARKQDGSFLLPLDPDHPQEVVFLCVDTANRTVAVLSHHYGHLFFE